MLTSCQNTLKVAKRLVSLKRKFAEQYDKSSHIQELIPIKPTENFAVEQGDLEHLHEFVRCNPIYSNYFVQKILDSDCMIYEGDIGTYWLDSIKHGFSCQPFYPTWLISAYVATLYTKNLGCNYIVDIGSGDGRIAYCGKILGCDSLGIEIDGALSQLQHSIIHSTGVHFDSICADATTYNYSFAASHTAFFIGGLPQMGGDMLADSVINKIISKTILSDTMFVFVGSDSKRPLSSNTRNGGWFSLIKKYGLKVIDTIYLPTVWTFDQDNETPYIFTKLV